MGWTFTTPSLDAQFQRNGQPEQVHADGRHAAWKCEDCGHPVLFIYRAVRAGSSVRTPATCRSFGRPYHLEPPYRDDSGQFGSHLRASGMQIV